MKTQYDKVIIKIDKWMGVLVMALGYKNILVGIDGSKGSEIALMNALNIAKRNDAHLDVLWVLDMNSLEYGNAGITLDGERIYKEEQECEQYINDLKEHLTEEGLPKDKVSVHLRFGNPKTVIVEDFQPEYKNDLIIVGETGKNFFKRIIVGSVASYVMRIAKCDVMIARTPESTAKEIQSDMEDIESE